ncbi:MAG: UDP-N-acetylmuramate dehydrogenase [Bacillota bacterium]
MKVETVCQNFRSLHAAKLSSLRAGGMLKNIACPSSVAELKELSKYIEAENIDYFVMGGLSNILVLDGGYDGIVISTNKLKGMNIQDSRLSCGSGEKLSKIIDSCQKRGLSGLEKLYGIPGTVGGAICMNSGCFDSEISSVVKKVYLFDMTNHELIEKTAEKMRFGYRKSLVQEGSYVIIGAVFDMKEKYLYDIKNTMNSVVGLRKSAQPSLPSLGSVFKKVDNISAAIFIEGTGLKGQKINNMQISNAHCNFIVNTGGGRADDYLRLVELMEKRVYEKYGIRLVREVRVEGKRA